MTEGHCVWCDNLTTSFVGSHWKCPGCPLPAQYRGPGERPGRPLPAQAPIRAERETKLRRRFARDAMHSLLQCTTDRRWSARDVATAAYEIADAMVEEDKKRDETPVRPGR